ncbi:GMC oxidoreductase [Leifsonia sp. NPDC058194]|uniref:GMC oxidoreductase n=1 Tax=Leifsonia sp. NPDC058194 TaxID=3346374 RepID=UPI0036DF66E0
MPERESVDVLIVGSGPIGSAYARTIRDLDPTLSVLMVEAGPQIATPAGRHVKTIVDKDEFETAQIAAQGPDQYRYGAGGGSSRTSEDAPVVARPGTFLLGATARLPGEDGMPGAAMSANVGGMGSHWTCACPPPGDGERIDLIPRDEFDELFAAGWELLHVTQDAFRDTPLGDEVRALLGEQLNAGRPADRIVQPMPLGITVDGNGDRYWTGPDVILGDLATGTHDGFELRSETLASRLLRDGTTVTGAVMKDRATGETYEVAARIVVVAGDALRTPQLLWASGIRPEALGRYLNDHPQVLGVLQLDDRFIPTGDRPAKTAAGTVDPLSGVSWIPYDRETFPFHGQIVQMDASPVPIEGVTEPWPGSIVGLGFFCTKDIQASDRVEFSSTEVDYFGMPQISIHYTLTETDRRTLTAASARITELANALGRLVDDRPPIVMPAGSSLHYMGTTRMGTADDGTSVCDTDSKVWGTSNLFVGGNGVIPTATACNPTATSVALAVRGARRIVDLLRD